MGLLVVDGINDFFQESLREDFSDKSLLMLGKQAILCNKVELYVFAKRLGVKLDYKKLSSDANGQLVKGGGYGLPDSYSFFSALGFREVHAMDISPYENADIIFDLNKPQLPPELINRFDYIVDGGTTEHVFNHSQALFHIAAMLKLNGKAFHYIPACGGWINHGYYCLQPSLMQDFYYSNGFKIERLNIILMANKQKHSVMDCVSTEPDYRFFNFRDIDDAEGYKGTLRCIAVKTEQREVLTNPAQVHWYGLLNGDILQEMWAVDLGLEDEDTKIGIWGVDGSAKMCLDIISHHSKFHRDKIKAFITNDNNDLNSFLDYPVIKERDILNSEIKTIFITTFDERIYKNLQWLEQKGINFVLLSNYRTALIQN